MARFDLYAFNGAIVVDLQADIVIIPGSRVVAPVLPQGAVPQVTKSLHPRVMIDNEPYVIATHLLAATPERSLNRPLGSVEPHADEITQALDILFQGF